MTSARQAMVSNLLVVLCGNRERPAHREQRQPVLMAEPKKQVPLRLNAKLYDALAAWAEDDFRSVNGQIEYLLTECVRQRKKNGKYVSDQIDVPPELDLK